MHKEAHRYFRQDDGFIEAFENLWKRLATFRNAGHATSTVKRTICAGIDQFEDYNDDLALHHINSAITWFDSVESKTLGN